MVTHVNPIKRSPNFLRRTLRIALWCNFNLVLLTPQQRSAKQFFYTNLKNYMSKDETKCDDAKQVVSGTTVSLFKSFDKQPPPWACTIVPSSSSSSSSSTTKPPARTSTSESTVIPLERKKTFYDLAPVYNESRGVLKQSSSSVRNMGSTVGSVLPRNTFSYRRDSSAPSYGSGKENKYHKFKPAGLYRRKTGPLSSDVEHSRKSFSVPFQRGRTTDTRRVAPRTAQEIAEDGLDSDGDRGGKIHKGNKLDVSWNRYDEFEEDDGLSDQDNYLEEEEDDLENSDFEE